MQRELLFDEGRVKQFVAALNDTPFTAEPARAIGVCANGKLICGVIFNEFRDHGFGRNCITMHASSTTPAWCTPFTLKKLLAYPFVDLGCVRMTTYNAISNNRAHKVLQRIGFKLEGWHAKGWDGEEDGLSWGLVRADAMKWIGEENADGRKVA